MSFKRERLEEQLIISDSQICDSVYSEGMGGTQ